MYISDVYVKDEILPAIGNAWTKAILLDGYFQDAFYFLAREELIKKEINLLLDQYLNKGFIVEDLITDKEDSVSVSF